MQAFLKNTVTPPPAAAPAHTHTPRALWDEEGDQVQRLGQH
jgi:hypothetical protein